ncbi:MAG: hypothetical protein LBE14_06355 [Treponema sp.]|jgi:hypothetical protein|nr:hypothetical protein [Treponema sp.]
MVFFNVSREWVILSSAAARTGADEIAHYLYQLRSRGGLSLGPPPVEDAAGPAPADSVPLIVLNSGETGGGRNRNGFSWRLGTDRLEIYGDSDRGLLNGVFDFLDALSIRWPEPEREELPPPAVSYPLARDKAYSPSAASPDELPRLFADGKQKPKDRKKLFRWAARNKIDVVVFSLKDSGLRIPAGSGAAAKKSPFEMAKQYALILEAGGWDLSLLVPRWLFPFRRELFRMESGKRTWRFNFCPTNPETITLLKKEAARIFRGILDASPEILIWHLWPDLGHETTWCSCPACRAFSAEDQKRIAVNAVADVLAELAPQARLSLLESAAAEQGPGEGISLRPNLFYLKGLPPEA